MASEFWSVMFIQNDRKLVRVFGHCSKSGLFLTDFKGSPTCHGIIYKSVIQQPSEYRTCPVFKQFLVQFLNGLDQSRSFYIQIVLFIFLERSRLIDHSKTGHFQPIEYWTPKLSGIRVSGIRMATVCLVQHAEFQLKVSMIFETNKNCNNKHLAKINLARGLLSLSLY